MFIVAGIYNWAAKPVAFRRDFCDTCDRETLAVGTRTLDFLHVFWVPVLPLGRWTRWRCTGCEKNPAVAKQIRRPFRIMLLVILVLMALSILGVTSDPNEYDFPVWIGRSTALIAILGVAWWAFRPTRSKDYKERRAAVRPYAESACPLCGSHLVRSLTDSSCSSCDAEHRPLVKKEGLLTPMSF